MKCSRREVLYLPHYSIWQNHAHYFIHEIWIFIMSWNHVTFFFSNIGKNYDFFRIKNIAYDFIVMFPLNAPHIIIWSRDTLFMKKRCKWYRRIVWKCLGNNGTFHTPNIPTLPLNWRRALESVKTITITLLQEPTDHKFSILNKYQVEPFYRKF